MPTFHGSSEPTNNLLSTAVEVNGLVYFSGQVHCDSDLTLHGETIEEKFAYTMERIEANLAKADLTKENIVRLQIYVTDIKELPALNAEYMKYFDAHPRPTRTAIGVTSLPLGADLEIDVIAVRK